MEHAARQETKSPTDLAGATASPQNGPVGARELIGLEAAIAELGALYVAAKEFAPLRAAADEELRLGTEKIASELRAHVRHDTLDATVLDRTAARVAELRARWRRALEELRTSPLYREACEAWRDGDAARLGELLPRVFADIHPMAPPPHLYFDVPLAAGRRGGAPSPFLSAEEAATRILTWRDEGVTTSQRGEWWRTDLGFLELVADPELLESSVGLRFEGASVPAAVLTSGGDDHLYRLYGSRIRAPFSVVLREESDDAWWDAAESSYEEFRDELASRLRDAGLGVAIIP